MFVKTKNQRLDTNSIYKYYDIFKKMLKNCFLKDYFN